jgi:hypothetical protein
MPRILCTLITCLALTVCLTAPAQAATPKQQLRSKARAYFNAQNDHRWCDACKMLSARALRTWGGGSIAACIDNFSTSGFSVTRMDIDRVTLRPGGRKGTVYTHLFGDRAARWNLTFVREAGTWKLDSTS